MFCRCRSLSLIALSLLLWTLAVPVAAEPGKTKALLIGVQDFVSPSFAPLGSVPTDLELMRSTLVTSCSLDPGNVVSVMSTRQGVVGKASLVATIEKFFKDASPDDALVVYISSHGIVYEGEYQIAITETRLAPDSIKATTINAGQLRKWSEQSKAKTVLVVLDTCQSLVSQKMASEIAAQGKAMSNSSSSALNNQVAAKFLGKPQQGPGVRAILYSCRPSEQSYMDTMFLTGTNNSYFTYALCEGLKGKAADASGEISLRALNDFTSKSLTELIEADRQQRQAKGHGPDQLPNRQTSNMEVLGGTPAELILATVAPQGQPAAGSTQASSVQPGYQPAPGYSAQGFVQPTSGYPAQTTVQGPVGYPAQVAAQAPVGYPSQVANLPPSGYPAQVGVQPSVGYPSLLSNSMPAYPPQAAGQPTSAYPALPAVQSSSAYPSQVAVQPTSGYPAQVAAPAPPSGYPAQVATQASPSYPDQAASPSFSSGHVPPAAYQSQSVSIPEGPAQVERLTVSGGVLEIFPPAQFQLTASQLPSAAKGLHRDEQSMSVNPSNFSLNLRCDRGESDANVRVNVQSSGDAVSSDLYVRVLVSPDRQAWSQVRDWEFRLPSGYRLSRDYVGADPNLFAYRVFFLRAEMILPNGTMVVREGRFVGEGDSP